MDSSAIAGESAPAIYRGDGGWRGPKEMERDSAYQK